MLLVANAVAASLDYADFVDQALHKLEGHFVPGLAGGRDALPVAFDQLRELRVRGEALPAQRLLPAVEEFSDPRAGPQTPFPRSGTQGSRSKAGQNYPHTITKSELRRIAVAEQITQIRGRHEHIGLPDFTLPQQMLPNQLE